MHRHTGWLLYLGVVLVLVLVEGAVVHLLLAIFASPLAAWVVTGLTAYSALWLVGDAHALRHGGVVVAADGLDLRIGVRWTGVVPWSAIRAIACGEPPAGALDASILGGNVVVLLREVRRAPSPVRAPAQRHGDRAVDRRAGALSPRDRALFAA